MTIVEKLQELRNGILTLCKEADRVVHVSSDRLNLRILSGDQADAEQFSINTARAAYHTLSRLADPERMVSVSRRDMVNLAVFINIFIRSNPDIESLPEVHDAMEYIDVFPQRSASETMLRRLERRAVALLPPMRPVEHFSHSV